LDEEEHSSKTAGDIRSHEMLAKMNQATQIKPRKIKSCGNRLSIG
jgi:hypothetical protein